ncbi:MAG TPA: flagellar filament capping protein FliD [Vicinamibacterales bacterium]|jgi:flagellar hook-associated protein 2
MGTITMSGFNNIDWSSILKAVMAQESQPLTAMQKQRSAMSSQKTAFTTLATKLSALETKASDLSSVSSFAGRKATSADTTVLGVSATSTAAIGMYSIEVKSLARAQVTTSSQANARTDIVANGGTLRITSGGVNTDIVLGTSPVTLEGLSAAINSTANSPVTASIVQANGKYQLVLTGASTGKDHAFTVDTSGLTAGSTISFNATPVMNATDADIFVNKVEVTSASNAIDGAIPGVTLNLLKETATGSSVGVSVSQDSSATKDKIQAFITSYNDLITFFDQQAQSARSGDTGSIGRDAMARGLRSTLSSTLLQPFAVGGVFSNLSEIGIEFQRTGQLGLNATVFDDAMKNHQPDVERLLAGTTGVTGAFGTIGTAIGQYVDAGGLVPGVQDRLDSQMKAMDDRMAAMGARLAIRQESLQREYAATDQLISQLNASVNSLSSLNNVYKLY